MILKIYYTKLIEKYKCYGESLVNINFTEEQTDDCFEELIECYTQFIDIYSDFCDFIIEKCNDISLINDSMLLYYIINKSYFKSKGDKDDLENIKEIIDKFKYKENILNYEFEVNESTLIQCNLCNGNGDIPDCIQCGKSSVLN